MKLKPGWLFILILTGSWLVACAGSNAAVERTPIPTLVPATLPAAAGVGKLAEVDLKQACQIRAVDLIGAWVTAGKSETDPFEFTDVHGQTCQGTFTEDVQFLFTESNVWFDGAIACAACHGPDLQYSYAQMNLSDFPGLLAGSRRQSADASGNDVFKGDWEQTRMYQVLITKYMPLGRPNDSPEKGPLVFAGKIK